MERTSGGFDFIYSQLVNHGTFTTDGDESVSILPNGIDPDFFNQEAGVLKFEGNGGVFRDIRSSKDAWIYNEGLIIKSAGAGETLLDSVRLDNKGTISIHDGSLVLQRSHVSSEDGLISFANGSKLRLAVATDFLVDGEIFGSGNGSLEVGPGAYLRAESGTTGVIDFDGSSRLVLRGSGVGAANGNLGDLNSGSLINQGNFIWAGGTIWGASFRNESRFMEAQAGTKLLFRTHFENDGAFKLESNDAIFIRARGGVPDITNRAGALFHITNDGGIQRDGSQIPIIENYGTFRKSQSTGTSLIGTVEFRNMGTVEVLAGTLEFRRPYIQTEGVTRISDATIAGSFPMEIRGGSLVGSGTITGDVVSAGLVSPGFSPGTLSISRNYTQLADGILDIEIGGLEQSEYDRLVVGKRAQLDGTLRISFTNGFLPKAGDVFDFIVAESIGGNFSSVVGLGTASRVSFSRLLSGGTYRLEVVSSVPLPSGALLFSVPVGLLWLRRRYRNEVTTPNSFAPRSSVH